MNCPSETPAYRINLRKLNLVLMLACAAGSIAYFMTINTLSTRGFAFRDLKQRANSLADENQRLESSMTSLASYQSLTSRLSGLRLVPSTDIAYISWDNRLVARR